jgi:uncharacterized membrane protein YraQ (UPF0718 family)
MIEQILTEISPALWQIIIVILTAVAGIIGTQIKKLYERYVDTNTKKEIAKTVVEAVEQLARTKGWKGEEKFAEAKNNIIQYFNNVGIKTTDIEIDLLIESAVNSFNQTVKSK